MKQKIKTAIKIILTLFIILTLETCRDPWTGCGEIKSHAIQHIGNHEYYIITVKDEKGKKHDIYVSQETWCKYYFSSYFCYDK